MRSWQRKFKIKLKYFKSNRNLDLGEQIENSDTHDEASNCAELYGVALEKIAEVALGVFGIVVIAHRSSVPGRLRCGQLPWQIV